MYITFKTKQWSLYLYPYMSDNQFSQGKDLTKSEDMKIALTTTIVLSSIAIGTSAFAQSPNIAFNPNKNSYKPGEAINVTYFISGMPTSQKWRVISYWTAENKRTGKIEDGFYTRSNIGSGNTTFTLRQFIPTWNPENFRRFKFHVTVADSRNPNLVLQSRTQPISLK